jgi:hypothetical protein
LLQSDTLRVRMLDLLGLVRNDIDSVVESNPRATELETRIIMDNMWPYVGSYANSEQPQAPTTIQDQGTNASNNGGNKLYFVLDEVGSRFTVVNKYSSAREDALMDKQNGAHSDDCYHESSSDEDQCTHTESPAFDSCVVWVPSPVVVSSSSSYEHTRTAYAVTAVWPIRHIDEVTNRHPVFCYLLVFDCSYTCALG